MLFHTEHPVGTTIGSHMAFRSGNGKIRRREKNLDRGGNFRLAHLPTHCSGSLGLILTG